MLKFARFRLGLVLALFVALVWVPGHAQAQSLLNQLVTPPDQQAGAAETDAPETALTAAQMQLLIDLLRDDAAREAVLAELERIAAGRAALAPPGAQGDATAEPGALAPADAAAAEEDESFGRRIAHQTQEIAQHTAARALGFWERLQTAPRLFAGLGWIDTELLLGALSDLALVIVATIAMFVILRSLAKRLYRRMGRTAKPMGFIAKAAVYVASVVVDALVVLLAWAAGYALAVTIFNEFGQIGLRQSLYLNAFLAVETVKVGVRAVLSPAVAELRPVQVGDHGARRTYRVLNIATSVVGYGQLLVVPIVAQSAGYYPGRSVSALLLLAALLVIAWAAVRNRRAVADWLVNGAGASKAQNRIWRAAARLWYIPLLLYLAAVFAIVVTQPGDVLLPVLGASARVLVASVVGWLLAGLLGKAMRRGIRMPASVNRRLPLLERRLNRFVPRVLFVLRFVILFAVIGYTMNAIGLFDVSRWLESEAGAWIIGTALTVALVLVIAFAFWVALASWVDYRLNPDFGTVPTAREGTLLTLLRNAAAVVMVAITLMFVLSELGVDIAPLIASAGIVGLAIGFGAQKMVQDIITGVFIQLENAINVGDVVTVAGTSGVVERLTIRSVSLRDLSGIYHIIPFSSVDTVSNFMREFAFVVIDMGVAYRVDVEAAKQAMFDAFEELRDDPEHGPTILDDLQWFGIDQFADSAVILRARIKTLPGKQWGVGRAYNGIIKRVFDERGIEIPFPHRTLYLGEGVHGEAPVAIRSVLPPDAAAAQGSSGDPADAGAPAAPEPGESTPGEVSEEGDGDRRPG